MSLQTSFGLKEEWSSVEETLRQVIPVYDKTNRYISFGTDLKVRRLGLELLVNTLKKKGKSQFSVLDLGAGPGKMTELLSESKPVLSVMLDALGPMMKVAKSRNPDSDGFLGVYERIPVKDRAFDCALAGFAIRDAKNLDQAISEVSRILVDGGLFLIVDLSKPESRAKRWLIGFYWRTLAPVIAFFAAGRLGLKFAALSKTVQSLPSSEEFLDLLKGVGFSVVGSRYMMLGGVCILLMEKSRI